MCLNVILPNLSLAYSSITFYQIVRVLLTPCVAVLNFFILRKTVPFHAALALIPVCIGVGMVTYFDSLPAPGQNSTNTTFWGVVFAFVGVFCSSVYTVWIKKYHDVLEMNSMQLLLNQAPVSVFLLLYVIPFSDDITVWPGVEGRTWVLIGMVSNPCKHSCNVRTDKSTRAASLQLSSTLVNSSSSMTRGR